MHSRHSQSDCKALPSMEAFLSSIRLVYRDSGKTGSSSVKKEDFPSLSGDAEAKEISDDDWLKSDSLVSPWGVRDPFKGRGGMRLSTGANFGVDFA